MKERTLVVLKPDAVSRNLVGDIMRWFHNASLRVETSNSLIPSRELASQHYGDLDTRYSPEVKEQVVSFMSSGPVIAMVIAGHDAIARVRKIVGATDPAKADPRSIRGSLGDDTMEASRREQRCVRNLIHASTTPEEAVAEINLWFPGFLR